MPENVHIGFNLNHAWLNGRTFEEVIQPLQNAGLDILELLVEFRYPEFGEHIEWLCEQAKSAGLKRSDIKSAIAKVRKRA